MSKLLVTGGKKLGGEGSGDEKILNREVGRLERSLSLAADSGLEILVFLHYPPIFCDIECTVITDLLKKYNVKRCNLIIHAFFFIF